MGEVDVQARELDFRCPRSLQQSRGGDEAVVSIEIETAKIRQVLSEQYAATFSAGQTFVTA